MNGIPRWPSCLSLLLLIVSDTRDVRGQNESTIPVRVTAVFEDNVYLDKGWADGICHGAEVLIDSGQGETIRATVRSVSSEDSRCVPIAGDRSIQVGMQGSVASAVLTHLPEIDAQPRWSDPPQNHGRPAGIDPAVFQTGRTNPGAIKRVDVRVTASSGGSIYLDKGRASGLRPGDEVTLFSPGGGIVNATVQSVSRNSSRSTILSGQQRIDIGTRGEVLLPADRFAPQPEELPTPRRDVPEHPPWTQPPESWDQNQPLLAPAYSREARERETQIHGRLFSQYLHTWNRNYAHNQYSLGRIGASLWMENPFRRGGGLHIDGEFNRRGIFLADEVDDIDGPGRLNRFSYHWGGTDVQPLRLEFGRLLSYEFPEFGIVDGTEAVYRTASGNRIGVSVGLLPEPFPNLAISNDLHVGAFYRWVSDPDETISSALGFQKTWHKGTPDRDLLIWTGDYNPHEHFSLHSTIWGDFYDSRDTLKSTSFEITEAVVQPIVRIDPGHGFGAHVSYIRWPQLLRREFSPFVEQQIVGDGVFRYGIFTWQDLSERVRFNGRVDQWHDRNQETGTSWEGQVACRELLFENGEVALAIYGTDGVFSSGPGGRVSVNRRFPWCFASLWYDIAEYELAGQTTGTQLGNNSSDLLQQSIRANLDFTVSSDKSVSVFLDYRFGPSQDAVQAGVFFQKRL